MTDERTRNLQRILDLRSLAESTDSQSEAMNAMKIAEKMMHAFRVTEAELALAEGLGEIKVEIVRENKAVRMTNGRNRHKIQNTMWSIERYCEVECVLYVHRSEITVIGDRPDVELFWYLFKMLRDSMDRSYAAWKRRQQAVGRGAKASFQLAFSEAVNRRLSDMIYERNVERKQAEAEAAKALGVDVGDVAMAVNNGDLKALSSNVSLVVASAAVQKRKQVDMAYKEAFKDVRIGTASGFGYASNTSAAGAGRQAGNSVGLGRPVDSNTSNLLQ